MRVVSLVTQKGGSGKTTLALSCAVAAEEAGKRVLLVDLDPQGTAEAWYQDREAETPRVWKKAGELGRLFQFYLFGLHSRIPPLECLPEFIVEHARAYL